MKKLLGTAVIIAAGFLGLSGVANAASLADAASLGSSVRQDRTERVGFRPYRHCHGPRWDSRCHGSGIFFFRDRDRDHRRWRDRDYDRRDYDRGSRHRDRNDY